jgi:FkbM family methyltransferase
MFFEPLEKNYNKLLENIGENFIKHKIALGNENKKIEMFVEDANMGQSSSILKPVLHLTQYPHIKFNTTEIVEMKRLDDLDIEINNFNFINIDVQGYELEVFKGSTETLKNIDYIMSEINRDEVYENCAKISELVEFLKPYGFELENFEYEYTRTGVKYSAPSGMHDDAVNSIALANDCKKHNRKGIFAFS